MAERFYVNCPLALGLVEIEGPEAHHLAAVCRARPGQRVCLFNGDGHEYPSEVVATSKRSVTLKVLSLATPPRELGFPLQVAVPLPKGDRAQFLAEKLTELGVTAYIPLRTQRSVVHPSESKMDKLERYVIEASKQCGRNVLMRIDQLTAWDTYCRRGDLPPTKIVAHPGCGTGFQSCLAGNDRIGILSRRQASGVALAVGPEGGFTDEEIDQARSAGWQVVGLGPRTLRVETAALALAAWAGMAADSHE